MPHRQASHVYPAAKANMATASGFALTATCTGLHVELHWREGACQDAPPVCAEVYSPEDESIYAEMGLEWEGYTLTGYDGAFSLPDVLVQIHHHTQRTS